MAYTLGNAMIYTGDKFIDKGYITVEGEKIVDVGEMELFHGYMERDLNGRLVMPAWVNAHTHVYSTLALGMSVEFHPMSFTQILKQLWWKLDKSLGVEEIQISAMIAAANFIHNGIATIFDHHSSPNYIKGSLGILKNAIVDLAGMRGVFCFETSDRDGTQMEALEENVNFYEKSKSDAHSSGMIGLHASFTLSDRTLERISEICNGKIPIHVHVAEGLEDELDSINNHNMRIIERFDHYDLLIENSIYAHCIHVNNEEVRMISKKGGFIVVNPQSNMNNAVGIPDLAKFKRGDAKVALGNDGFGFSPAFDFRLLALSQKHLNKDSLAFSSSDIKNVVDNSYELATNHLKERFGKVKPGFVADISVVDYKPATPITYENFYDHLFFGITEASVNSLYVAGKPIMIDGEIKTFDEKEIRKISQKMAKNLWKKL